MKKIKIKDKPIFLNNTQFTKSKNFNLEFEEKINPHAIWLQTMEPSTYAKKNKKKIYKIQNIKIECEDTEAFKNLLFKNIEKQLNKCKTKIKKEFLKTSDGSLNVGLNVILIDSMLKELIKNIYLHFLGETEIKLSIIAVGGYGRGELAPNSDLDILFLKPNRLKKIEVTKIEKVIQLTLYLLWDLGYTVGHSTRTISECIKKSNLDITVCTSLLEKRFITGNKENFKLLKDEFTSYVNKTKTLNFVEAKLEESELRHKKFGGSRYVVEPNVKDGKGGLRDLHTLFWISKFAYNVDSISKLINIGALTKKEAIAIAEAQRFLFSVRCHLHYRSKREDDRLAMDAQLEIAKSMNFKNTITQKDVERFMKRYFLATKAIGNLTRIFCAAIETEFNKPLRLKFLSFRKSENVYPFTIELGRLYAPEKKIFTQNPINIINLFYLSHYKNIDIHPKTLRLLTSLIFLINSEVRNDINANRMFLDILTSNRDSTRTLRIMNESNILGKFIPEFQKIVGLMQFDMYHSYTVDEHTIFTISNLHSLKNGDFIEFAPLTSNEILKIKSNKALFVAMLLHDIAKGQKGDHSENGALIAIRVCPRFGLNIQDTKMVIWLVKNHLLMSKTAFKYELGDPKVIKSFSQKVRSLDKLRSLLALTVADIKGVGPDVWNDWKGALIKELYIKTFEILKPKHEKSKITEPLKTSKELLTRHLTKIGLEDYDVRKYFNKYYDNYWKMFNLSSLIKHYEIFSDMKIASKKLEIFVSEEQTIKATEIIVIAPDHHGLFSQISGLVASSGYDIVSAKIVTRSDGFAVDTFFIQNKDKKPLNEDYQRKKLIETIKKGLLGNYNIEKALNIKWKETPARFRAVKTPTRVIFDNTSSDNYTILEVKCKNAPGVLYKITKTISSLGFQINTANISTYGDRVIDNFYIKNMFGSKVDDDLSIKKVKVAINNTLKELEPES